MRRVPRLGAFRTDLGRVPDDDVEDKVQALRLIRLIFEIVFKGPEKIHKC